MYFKNLYEIQNTSFNIFIAITYITYGLIVFGLFTSAPQYLITLDNIVKLYISAFLFWRFNPFRRIKFSELDRKIVFSSGIFLFTTTAINQALINYLMDAKTVVQQRVHLFS